MGIGGDTAVPTLIGATAAMRENRPRVLAEGFLLVLVDRGRRLSLVWEELSDCEGTSDKGGP